MSTLRKSLRVFFLLGVATVSAHGTVSHAGEITFVEWHSNPYIPNINVRYFDTQGSRAVCTGFYKDKPVGAGSAYINNGIAEVTIRMPDGARADSKNTTVRCRTE